MEHPITRAQIDALVAQAKAEEAEGRTLRLVLSDDAINYLAVQAQDGDEPAMVLILCYGQKLIAPHLKAVKNWTRFPTVGPEDMWQEGRIMLLKALAKYEPSRGYNFGAYAARIIANHLNEWSEAQQMTMTVPRHARRRLRREGPVDDTTRSAQAASTIPDYMSKVCTVQHTRAGGAVLAELGTVLQDSLYFNRMGGQESVEDSVLRRDRSAHLEHALSQIDPLHRQILLYRYVHEMSVERAAKMLHLGMGTLRANEREALARLCDMLEEAA